MSGAPDNVTIAKAPAIKFAKNAAATNRLSASMTTGGRSAAIVISSVSQRLLGSNPMKDEVQGRNDLRRSVLDALNAVAPAVENLSVHQEQCDCDGVMVKVSRQALDEVLSAVNEVAFQAAITPTPIADSSAQKSAPSSIGSLPSGESDPSVMLGFDGADTNSCPADSSEAGTGRDAYVGVLASLAAAISLLERTPRAKKAAASDKMFDQMIADYKKALKFGRAALADPVWVSVAKDIHHVLDEGDGHWRGCSGCHELSDGAPTGPYSDTFRCHLGLGCSECGGIGAVWDNSDYSEFTQVRAALSAPVGEPVANRFNEIQGVLAGYIKDDVLGVKRARLVEKIIALFPPAPAVGAEDVARAANWKLVDGTMTTGESVIFDGSFIVAKVTRRQDAELILSLLSGQGGGPTKSPAEGGEM